MNLYDSSKMAMLMIQRSYELTDDPLKATLVLINSCSIREKAEQKFFSQIGRLQKIKEKKSSFYIAVSGCVAQREKNKLFKLFPGIDLIIGTLNIENLPRLVEQLEIKQKRICEIYDEPLPYKFNNKNSCPNKFTLEKQVTAWITIMEGCNNFCSYCVVPYVRGRERSRPPEHILEQIKHLVDSGCKEVTLLGQNVNSYGAGLKPCLTFSELLYRINRIDGLSRIRFTTSHPKDFSSELIAAIQECSKVCEHVHLPLQSGSNKVLARMNRGYTIEEYLEKVTTLKSAIPTACLTGDMIVGFPGETYEDFENTLDIIKKVRFDGLFSFKYSKRPQTAAAKYKGHVKEKDKSERLILLQNLQNQIGLEKNKELVGKHVDILIEGKSKKDTDKIFGRTRGNKIVNLAGNDSLIHTTLNVKIKQAKPFDLIGQLQNVTSKNP